MAEVTDFCYTIYDPPLLGHEEPILGRAIFGVCEDDGYRDAFRALMHIDHELRSYDDQKWNVFVTGSTKKLLCDTFHNVAGLIEEAENPLPREEQ